MAALTVSTARVLPRGQVLPRYRWDPFCYCKTHSPAFEVCSNKIWKAGKISFFSTKCPRSNHIAGNAWTVIAWPCNHKSIVHAARSPTADNLLNTVYSSVKAVVSPRFKMGDSVRISKFKTIFKKGYIIRLYISSNWTTEVFRIVKV